ncbi:hypothetical protein ILUMI_10664 [Ignelater luminosus]|uniref:SIFamide n=1 Tax=Ignelater luminosus TaxID=2038154 RepID=A0A8K0GDY7_IGNLU|nr:hypothetical protein ILUMI_10664 [Ignelater luminosus]
MVFAYIRTATFVLVAVVFISWFMGAEGTYRKPPFNGSIFGKRGVTAEYDNANKALSALCEIAIDACQPWFPSQEK